MKDTNCFPSRCDASCGAESAVPTECLRQWVAEAGGAACGVADALAVADDDFARFDKWLARGMHGGMRYMENYRELRRDPQLLLPGAKSVVVAAFSYYHSDQTEGNLASIAAYAHGDDYHEVVRERLGGSRSVSWRRMAERPACASIRPRCSNDIGPLGRG